MKRVTPETLLKKSVKEYLDYTGWFHFPLTQGLGSYPGLPDRVAVKGDITLFIEIKSKHGILSDYQKRFQANIEIQKSKTIFYIVIKTIEELNGFIERLTDEKILLFG